MEPFGLFHFLQSLLASSGEQKPRPEEREPAENEAEQAPIEKNDALRQAESDAQTAFLQFMETHDERAKRTKKP